MRPSCTQEVQARTLMVARMRWFDYLQPQKTNACAHVSKLLYHVVNPTYTLSSFFLFLFIMHMGDQYSFSFIIHRGIIRRLWKWVKWYDFGSATAPVILSFVSSHNLLPCYTLVLVVLCCFLDNNSHFPFPLIVLSPRIRSISSIAILRSLFSHTSSKLSIHSSIHFQTIGTCARYFLNPFLTHHISLFYPLHNVFHHHPILPCFRFDNYPTSIPHFFYTTHQVAFSSHSHIIHIDHPLIILFPDLSIQCSFHFQKDSSVNLYFFLH